MADHPPVHRRSEVHLSIRITQADKEQIARLRERLQELAGNRVRVTEREVVLRALDALESRGSEYRPARTTEAPEGRRPPAHVEAPARPVRQRSASGGMFTKEDALDWLQLHGDWSRITPKTWPGWQTLRPDKTAILALAIEQDRKRSWRQTWTLHPCQDPECICHEAIKG